jgi:hypothetical protein
VLLLTERAVRSRGVHFLDRECWAAPQTKSYVSKALTKNAAPETRRFWRQKNHGIM